MKKPNLLYDKDIQCYEDNSNNPRQLKQIFNDMKYLFLVGISLLIVMITMYKFEMI